MEFTDFKKRVDIIKKKKPLLFGLEHDYIPNMNQIDLWEQQNHIWLPEKYISFLLTYGGGYFGYTTIYSLDTNSDFYILNQNPTPIKKYINISDNGCGDYYMFYVTDNKCQDSILFYYHDSKKVISTNYSDILEYLLTVGLNEKL